jgi:uncharacterized membrane protein
MMAPELVVLVFRQAGDASRAFQALKKQSEREARNAVVLIRDHSGETFVFETGNVEPQNALLLGSIAGLLVELLGGSDPKRAAAEAVSMGLPAEYLTALRTDLPPGGSALVILLEAERVEGTLDLLAPFQGRVWQLALADNLLAQFATEGNRKKGRE